jgi:hypothetical protein
MVNKNFDIIEFFKTRPLSWSSMSSFEYNPEEWYENYILGKKKDPSPEMLFGKIFAESCENRKPLAPVTLLSKMEQPFKVVFGKIHMVGFADTFDDVLKTTIGEYKTGKMTKPWTQDRVDKHGQITLYALFNLIKNKIKPDDCKFFLEWVPTIQRGDFSIEILKNEKVRHFDTKRTMKDVLEFGVRINRVVKDMEKYVRNHV